MNPMEMEALAEARRRDLLDLADDFRQVRPRETGRPKWVRARLGARLIALGSRLQESARACSDLPAEAASPR